MSTQKQFSEFSKQNMLSNFNFISKQIRFLSETIIATINIKINRLNDKLREILQVA